MTGKSLALALAAGLLLPTAAQAVDERVQVQRGLPAAESLSVAANEAGSGVTVVRGSSGFTPRKALATAPLAVIDGEPVRLDSLEPAGNWFLDRSGARAVLVHCYTRQSIYVGGGRRILCDAQRL